MTFTPQGMSRRRLAVMLSVAPAAFGVFAVVAGGDRWPGFVALAAASAAVVDVGVYLYVRSLRNFFGRWTGVAALVVVVAVVVAVVSLLVPSCPTGTGRRCSFTDALDTGQAAALVAVAFAAVAFVPFVAVRVFSAVRRGAGGVVRGVRRVRGGVAGGAGKVRPVMSEQDAARHAAAVRRRQRRSRRTSRR